MTAVPLTAAAFAPFGDVLELSGDGRRRYFDEGLGDKRRDARPRLSLSRIPALETFPASCELMEHHPHSTQTFLPMSVSRYLIMVAPAKTDGGPDVARLRAFIGRSGQGITYRAGTWHHGMRALDEPALFAVFMWQDGGPFDEIFVPVEPSISVQVDPASPGSD